MNGNSYNYRIKRFMLVGVNGELLLCLCVQYQGHTDIDFHYEPSTFAANGLAI